MTRNHCWNYTYIQEMIVGTMLTSFLHSNKGVKREKTENNDKKYSIEDTFLLSYKLLLL